MAVNAYSNHSDYQLEDIPGIWWEKVPTLCLPNEILWEYANEKGMQPLNVSYGRAGAKPDGEIVYIVTYWVGIETNETMASVQVPEGDYSCVLFRTFDTQDHNLRPKNDSYLRCCFLFVLSSRDTDVQI